MIKWPIDAIRSHAANEYPAESCGLVVNTPDGVHYLHAINVATDPSVSFIIDPYTWVRAESYWVVIGIVHSHPDGGATPSVADVVGCKKSGVPWLVISWPGAETQEITP